MVKLCQDLLIEKMPALDGALGYYPRGQPAIAKYRQEQDQYDRSDVRVYLDADLTNADVAYLPLNCGEAFGRLRVMSHDQLPGPRDVALYESLPNELPRVAGIITAVRQTPLSHVNLRAIQDQVPNAYIADAAGDDAIRPLVGEWTPVSTLIKVDFPAPLSPSRPTTSR